MGATFRFLAINNESGLILDWFRQLAEPPEEVATQSGFILYFRKFGSLVCTDSDSQSIIDSRRSPLVSVFPSKLKRGVLWTAGEVHFFPTPLAKACPQLQAVRRRFGKWLAEYELVFSREPGWPGQWNYYLEGSLQNISPKIFALPKAMEGLRRGQYFVADDDNDWVLEKVCRELKKRGVQGIQPGSH